MFPYKESIAAVLGGDKRELEIVRNLLSTGITVRTYGWVKHPDYGVPGPDRDRSRGGTGCQ
jgi:hypothetical protein